jgi:hypothetical protein
MRLLYLVYFVAGVSGCGAGEGGGGPPAMSLSFADEFEGPAGARPDVTRWINDVGGNGWGNDELRATQRSTVPGTW